MQRTRTQTFTDRFKSVSLDTFFSKKFYSVLAANVLVLVTNPSADEWSGSGSEAAMQTALSWLSRAEYRQR